MTSRRMLSAVEGILWSNIYGRDRKIMTIPNILSLSEKSVRNKYPERGKIMVFKIDPASGKMEKLFILIWLSIAPVKISARGKMAG